MKTSSAKAKGRRLQQKVRDLICDTFDLPSDDVRSTSMGASGEDVLLSAKAKCRFPFSVECKNVEKLNLWNSWEQAAANESSSCNALLVVKRNYQEPLAIVDLNVFMELAQQAYLFRRYLDEK